MPPKGFRCKKCGNCCYLGDAYDTSAKEEDMLLWEKKGRADILEWVSPIDCGGGQYVYAIWISPRTGDYVSRCPWLRKLPDKNKYICRIHAVKPEHCREFPKSRKHAKEAKWKGFEK